MSYKATAEALRILVELREEPAPDLEQRLGHLEEAIDNLFVAMGGDLMAHVEDCELLVSETAAAHVRYLRVRP